jgi:hypothetical protein
VADQYPFRINQGISGYPVTSGNLIFGAQDSHKDFVTPMARFEFFDAFASTKSEAAIVFIRMGGTFQTTLSNGYSESQNIFGTPDANPTDSIWSSLKTTGNATAESILKQIKFAASGAQGFIQSAGLGGKSQYEFITKRFLNNFQQLIYQGPTFRRFTLPFTMRPTSLSEAEKMVDIVNTFRFASSPKGGGTTGDTFEGSDGVGDLTGKSPEQIAELKAAAKITAEDINLLVGTGVIGGALDSAFSFGYPDTCKFTLLLQKNATGDTALTELFTSEYCVIENVSVDYGSQNKMVFFSSGGGNKYYPSEVTVTINLRETSLPTTGTLGNERTSTTRTIF